MSQFIQKKDTNNLSFKIKIKLNSLKLNAMIFVGVYSDGNSNIKIKPFPATF